MSDVRLPPIKVTLDRGAEPALFSELLATPSRSRARRIISLAQLGVLVERQGMGGLTGSAPRVPIEVRAGEQAPENVGGAPQQQGPQDLQHFGEGLDDLISNIGGPIQA